MSLPAGTLGFPCGPKGKRTVDRVWTDGGLEFLKVDSILSATRVVAGISPRETLHPPSHSRGSPVPRNNNNNDFLLFGYPNTNSWLPWKVNLVTEQHSSKFSRTLASRPILSVTASRLRPGAKKEKARSVGCSSARLARSGCRGFAPAALAREASPRRDATIGKENYETA